MSGRSIAGRCQKRSRHLATALVISTIANTTPPILHRSASYLQLLRGLSGIISISAEVGMEDGYTFYQDIEQASRPISESGWISLRKRKLPCSRLELTFGCPISSSTITSCLSSRGSGLVAGRRRWPRVGNLFGRKLGISSGRSQVRKARGKERFSVEATFAPASTSSFDQQDAELDQPPATRQKSNGSSSTKL